MNQSFVKARSRLILDNPFFGTLCLRLKPVEREDIDTGATDGKSLIYNPTWFEKLRPEERIGFLAHEVMHVVFMHHLRRQERQPQKWNVAADYVINLLLEQEGFILPSGGLLDSQYADMTTEHVYSILPEPPEGWDSLAADFGGCGSVIDHPDATSQQTSSAIEAQLTVAINQAAEVAKASGKLSSKMESIVGLATKPKVDWRMVLARFLRSNNQSDYSWIRPNRRFIAQGMYLPSAHNPCLGEIAVAVDTSGSVSDEELQQFTTEASTILQDLAPNAVHFIQCDSEVQSDDTYTRESLPLKVTYRGRGGTAFEPVISYINEKHPNVEALVYLTDLESNDFGDQPPYPVLWITTNAEEAPYGEIIKI